MLLWPLKLVGIISICFSGMPCLESENNGFLYVLPQVSYLPHVFYIPVALTSKVLSVSKQKIVPGTDVLVGEYSSLALAPASSSAGSPAT